jgi:hypothetical protein
MVRTRDLGCIHAKCQELAHSACPPHAELRIDIVTLRMAIAEDRAAGFQPACVIGTAGTANTGANRHGGVPEQDGRWAGDLRGEWGP